MSEIKYPPTWLTYVIAGANILAIADLPFGYYQLLRLIVTAYTAYIAFIYFRRDEAAWAWGFTFLAVLYNPVFPIEMSKEVHAVHNLAAAAAIILEYRKARRGQSAAVVEAAPSAILSKAQTITVMSLHLKDREKDLREGS